MIEIRHGLSTKPVATDKILGYFNKRTDFEGILYIGYPILFTAGESVVIDALWVSQEYGIIIFNLIDGIVPNSQEIAADQDRLFDKVEAMLVGYPHLKTNRKFVGQIDVITFAPLQECNLVDLKIVKDENGLDEVINTLTKWAESTEALYTAKVSIVQSIINLKSAPKRTTFRVDSKGATIKILENAMSTLDADQEKAVIESYNGVQRIRGLAGSGKTIVLALKAAYIHALHPEWNIAITFNSRALKKQFKDLLNIFSIQRTGYPFDENKVHIIHAWGSANQGAGIYYNFCISHNINFLNVNEAKSYQRKLGAYNYPILELVSKKALDETKKFSTNYDAILVDEAQDLSVSFLKICFNILDSNKRLIYAYDELQTLDEGSSLPKPSEMFGIEASKDTILQVCYRNSRPILVTAHALGFGIYRDTLLLKPKEPKLVQFFDEPQLWSDLGYINEGQDLVHGNNIILSRTDKSSPAILEKHASEIIEFKSFLNTEEQAEWVTTQIQNDIYNEELLHKDILIINPVSYTTTDSVAEIRNRLFQKDINSHIAGAFNPDVFLEDNSIAISGIRRAKGNEVPMVYIINAQDCFSGSSLMKLRNILFTAITRSKAWVRVLGIGENMDRLIKEFDQVKASDYKLNFIYPSAEEIEKMNVIHREKTEIEVDRINEETSLFDKIFEIVDRIKRGESNIEDYPLKVR
jgi:superfamily I DNA and RNA helicase